MTISGSIFFFLGAVIFWSPYDVLITEMYVAERAGDDQKRTFPKMS